MQNVTSTFEGSFNKITQLADVITDIAEKKPSLSITEQLKLANLRAKLETMVNTVLDYKILSTDPGYKLFNDINKRLFAINVYLTRIVAMVNKLSTALENVSINAPLEDDEGKIKNDVVVLNNIYRKRTIDMIYLHFDVITNMLWSDKDNYTFVRAVQEMCDAVDLNNTAKQILSDEKRTKSKLCALHYEEIYSAIHNVIVDDYDDASKSLDNLVKLLSYDDSSDVIDIFKFFKDR